ncbi:MULTISPECIES: hypothetical protein [unclassified Brevundimonas]|uniref:hypothetical protein n=2 Tax=unclassified Brevundimonas TaxID=2622653 RepID=UPI0025C36C7E|nr:MULTISPECIES: hypothetical protein [unclassified Brevundimonas]
MNTCTHPMNPLPSVGDRVRTDSTVAILREPAFELLSRIQDANPSDQVRALFLVAAVISDAIGIDGHDALNSAKRMLTTAEGPHTIHVQAIRDYADGELRRAG